MNNFSIKMFAKMRDLRASTRHSGGPVERLPETLLDEECRNPPAAPESKVSIESYRATFEKPVKAGIGNESGSTKSQNVGNHECWDGGVFTFPNCCDFGRFGAGGNQQCWTG